MFLVCSLVAVVFVVIVCVLVKQVAMLPRCSIVGVDSSKSSAKPSQAKPSHVRVLSRLVCARVLKTNVQNPKHDTKSGDSPKNPPTPTLSFVAVHLVLIGCFCFCRFWVFVRYHSSLVARHQTHHFAHCTTTRSHSFLLPISWS